MQLECPHCYTRFATCQCGNCPSPAEGDPILCPACNVVSVMDVRDLRPMCEEDRERFQNMPMDELSMKFPWMSPTGGPEIQVVELDATEFFQVLQKFFQRAAKKKLFQDAPEEPQD